MLPKLSSSGRLSLPHCHLMRVLLRFSTASATASASASATASVGENPSPKAPFMVEYLISSCGFSTDRAIKAIKAYQRVAQLTSPQKPDSFLGFIRSHGFNEVQIRKLISWNPRFLCCNVEKNVKLKFQGLQDLGFSGSDLTELIVSNPNVLNLNFHRTVQPRIEFWRGFVGSRELLTRLFKNNTRLLGTNLEKRVIPNLSLLRECGVPDRRTALAAIKTPWFIMQSPERLNALVEWVEALGIPRRSGMFLWALWAVFLIGKARFGAKLKVMMSFGWSEPDFLLAFRKAPLFVTVSEDLLVDKMDFLVKQAGCEPLSVALHPVLLMFSLEKRLIPRHRVMQILKSSGLHSGKYKLTTIMNTSEKEFMKRYVLRHKEKVPGLEELYVAGCGRGADTPKMSGWCTKRGS